VDRRLGARVDNARRQFIASLYAVHAVHVSAFFRRRLPPISRAHRVWV
jgi:hypothetical protein